MTYQFEINCIEEKDGTLTCFESNMVADFHIARVFFISGVPNSMTRANHACMNSNFVFIAITGIVKLSVENNNQKKIYTMDKINNAVYVPRASWISAFDFSEGAVLMVLSDKNYKDCNYVDNYDDYRRRMNENNDNWC